MVSLKLKNAIFRKVVNFEEARSKCPQGRKRKASLAYLLDRILYICRTGCQWINLPVETVSPKTVFRHFTVWSRACIFEGAFYDEVRIKTVRSKILVADTSFVKNVYGRDVLGKNPTDRGRRATKISLLTDGLGMPVTAVFHQANRSDCKTLPHLLTTANRKVPGILAKFSMITADSSAQLL
jgi:transposase